MRDAEIELAAFETFFIGLGNSQLMNSERALLKTYLVARMAKMFESHLDASAKVSSLSPSDDANI